MAGYHWSVNKMAELFGWAKVTVNPPILQPSVPTQINYCSQTKLNVTIMILWNKSNNPNSM